MTVKRPGRLALLALAALAVTSCGKSGSGWTSSSDVDRTVALPPHDVYRAFSKSLPGSGTIGTFDESPDGVRGPITAKIKKKLDESILFSLEGASDQLVSIHLQFEPAQQGAATRVRGDLDINPIVFAKGPDDPQRAHDKFRRALNETIDDVANGRPLLAMKALGMSGGSGSHRHFEFGEARAAESHVGRSGIPMSGGKVVPMQSARPMLDPNAVARRNSFPQGHPRGY